MDGVPELDGVLLGVFDGVLDGVLEGVGVLDGVAELVVLGVLDGVGDTDIEDVLLTDGVGVLLGVLEGVAELVVLGVGVLEGVLLGVLDGVAELVVLGVGVTQVPRSAIDMSEPSPASPPLNQIGSRVNAQAQSIYTVVPGSTDTESVLEPPSQPSAHSWYLIIAALLLAKLSILYV